MKNYLALLVVFLLSCHKQDVWEIKYEYADYKLISDWYTYDTIPAGRRDTLWPGDKMIIKMIYPESTVITNVSRQLDFASDQWLKKCWDSIPHLEHWYYVKRKDSLSQWHKLQTSNYPNPPYPFPFTRSKRILIMKNYK